MPGMRSIADAQHEAAHVVVGVALGLKLYRVWLGEERVRGEVYLGCSEWDLPLPREADLIMTAAGVVWERRHGDLSHAAVDLRQLRRAGVRGRARLVALERAAWAVLFERSGLHSRVTRELVQRDLGASDIRSLMRGERLGE